MNIVQGSVSFGFARLTLGTITEQLSRRAESGCYRCRIRARGARNVLQT